MLQQLINNFKKTIYNSIGLLRSQTVRLLAGIWIFKSFWCQWGGGLVASFDVHDRV